MMTLRRCLLMFLVVCWTGALRAEREAHGSSDVYAERGVAVAWAVLRGARDSDTAVVIRVATDAAMYPFVSVAGVNPFSKAESSLKAPGPVAGSVDVQVERTRFADFPRTEIRLYPNATQGTPPALAIYYLGVPDTTPEFLERAKLDAYLTDRIARARDAAAKAAR